MKKRLLLAYIGGLLGMALVLSIDGSTSTRPMHVLTVECNDNNNMYTVTFKDDSNGELWQITTNNKYGVNGRYTVTLTDDTIKAVTPCYENCTITSR